MRGLMSRRGLAVTLLVLVAAIAAFDVLVDSSDDRRSAATPISTVNSGPAAPQTDALPASGATANGRSSTAAASLDLRGSASAPRQSPSSAWDTISHAQDLLLFLENARAAVGANDPNYRSIYAQIETACSRAKENSTRFKISPPREEVAWAFESLKQKCSTFTHRDDLIPVSMTPGPILKHIQGDARGAITDAQRWASTSSSAPEIVEAIELLRQAGALPESETRLLESGLSVREQEEAIRNAALLFECNANNACGPESFAVLAYCAEYGCKRGITLAAAMQASMTPRSYETANRLIAWLGRQRSATVHY